MTRCLNPLVVALLPVVAACSSGGGAASGSATSSAATKPAPAASASNKQTPRSGPGPSAAASTDTPPASTEKPVGDHAKDPVLSEAKNAIGAIARAAQEAYSKERMPTEIVPDDSAGQQLSQALCTSAKPTPEAIPSGGEKKDADFATGDENSGWKCLRFALGDDVSFRYTYNAGSNYLGPKRGGVDPGPDGFEACAEADLTPGGLTTLICLTGKVNKETRVMKTDTQIFQADE